MWSLKNQVVECELLRITSWLPPSTILTEDTSVSFASRFKSARFVTPQLHMVDFIL